MNATGEMLTSSESNDGIPAWELEARLTEARQREKAIASLKILKDRLNMRKLPSRLCLDILSYRYSPYRFTDLGKERLTIQKFTQLIRYMTKSQIEAIAACSLIFEEVISILPEEKDFHPSWYEHFLSWKGSNLKLAILFLQEVTGAIEEQEASHDQPRPKRQRVDLSMPASSPSKAESSLRVDFGIRKTAPNQQFSATESEIHLDSTQSCRPQAAFDSRTKELGSSQSNHITDTQPSNPVEAHSSPKLLASIGDFYTLTKGDVEMVVANNQFEDPIRMIDSYKKEARSLVSFYITDMASSHFTLKYTQTGTDPPAEI
ncbi:hypothetical protein F5Y06DRAFT_109053 [Hypoxylon sp. FL0890]|nr:hypothetical protein F5Y06DRAFT_109053 [Hypoxylon sp. FL0890]